MMRPHRMLAWVLVLLAPATVPAQSGADLIPEDATAAFVINSISGVRDKGEKFIKDNDLNWPPETRPSTLFDRLLQDYLGLTKGVDEKGSAAVVLPNLKKLKADKLAWFDFLDLLYVAVPVADVDQIASNYDIGKGQLKPDKVQKAGENRFVLLKDKHLYVARTEKALSLLPDMKPVTAELGAEQKVALSKSDLALHLGVDALGPLFSSGLDTLEQNMKRADDAADNSQSKQFIDALRQIRYIVGGLTLDDGGKFNIIASFNKGKGGEAATKFLTALRAGPGTSELIGLPNIDPVGAYAAKGDGVSNVAMVRALINILFDQGQIEKVLPGKERNEVVAAFETMYRELKGSRAGMYPTSDAKKFGRLALVGILDLGDVEKHLGEWPGMVKLLSRAAARASEGDKRKPPEFSYQPKAETIDGQRVDLLTMKWPDLTADEEKFYTNNFGPEWNKTRLAVVGKQVVVLSGSDLDLLKQTIANLKGGKKGLAENKVVMQELSRLAPERKIEFHLNLRNVRLAMQDKPAEAIKGLTSFAIAIETDRLQLEIVAAKSEIKSFAAFLGIADD